MSDGGMPYVGSMITLISVKGCRYTGTLVSVDPPTSSLALQNVRSFGTEDRQVEKAIPPSDQVYPCIIFNAADIKDLTVCQAPVSQPPLQDPAIMGYPGQPGAPSPYGHGHYNPYDSNQYGAPPGYGYNPYAGYNPYGQPQYPPGYGHPGAPQPQPTQASGAAAPSQPTQAASSTASGPSSSAPLASGSTSAPQTAQPQTQAPAKAKAAVDSTAASAASQAIAAEKKASQAAATAASQSQPKVQQRDLKTSNAQQQQQQQQQHTKPQLPTPKPVPTHQPTAKKSQSAAAASSSSSSGGKLSAADIVQRGMAARGELKMGGKAASTSHAAPTAPADVASSPQRISSHQRPSQRRTGPSSNSSPSTRSTPVTGATPPAQPVGEFDFEKSNALFNKEEFFKTAVQADGAEEDIPPSYQKDDFFDSLSCEALDRQRQLESGQSSRPSNQELNARDMAAFGTTVSGYSGHRGSYNRNYSRNRRGGRGSRDFRGGSRAGGRVQSRQ
eukprot:CAMPEP_0174230916 /NCGR_PEP_ID=MMETSP0417-20130205/1550_1 /TAXON_ID=242541 /ORGANISM="Mayorella sp, Strain BSH-02190019" /LENGTH=499 /DNA_ID=CAMNT_0015308685 /DNA_START=147 /DNA_END=1646 /DNA_ORIENTATION=+